MYLKNAPVYFVRDGIRRAVYHSVVANELQMRGWRKEEVAPAAAEVIVGENIQKPEVVVPKVEVTTALAEAATPVSVADNLEPNPEALALMYMTKNELIEYASQNDLIVNPYAHKADILAICMESLNG